MTSPTALAELAETISSERELLTTGLAELTELFYGENGYAYFVLMDSPDGKEQVSWTFRNSPEVTYPRPVVGTTWPRYLEGRNDWVIKYSERFFQQEALDAQEELKRAKGSVSGLESMTSEDLDALIELPDILDQNTQTLRAARKYFRDAGLDMAERRVEVAVAEWTDNAAEKYKESIAYQQGRFDTCGDDVDVLDEANVKLAEAAIAVYNALADIYITEMEESGSMIKAIIDLPKNLTNWQFYAKGLADLMVDATTRHAKDFKAKVTELGDMVDAERIISKTEEIAQVDWALPVDGVF